MSEITIGPGNGIFDLGYIVPLPDAYVAVTNDSPNLVVDVPFAMPMKPENFAGFLGRMQQRAAEVVEDLNNYPDQNVARAMLHLIGNMAGGLESAHLLESPKELPDEEIERFKLFYVRSAVGLGNACEIAQNLLSGTREGFSAQEMLNFARYDAFCKDPKTTTDFRINGVNIDEYQDGLKLETALLVHIFELVHNASKAGASHIQADLYTCSGGVTFMIDDNGHGIAREDILDIFKKDYSTRPASERKEGRGGLGLYYLAQFVALRRGSVFAQSFLNGTQEGVRCEAVAGKPESVCRSPEFATINTRFMISIPDNSPI
jgi:signal transduction histidine kinase